MHGEQFGLTQKSIITLSPMSFRLISARFDGRSVPFGVPEITPAPQGQNTCTVLIGRNGVGKSRLLAAICRAFAALDEGAQLPRERSVFGWRRLRRSEIELDYALDGQKVTLGGADDSHGIFHVSIGGVGAGERFPTPTRVIATTITPSDKFPSPDLGPPRRDAGFTSVKPGDRIYRYLGGKSGIDSISSRQRLSRVVDALVRAAGKSGAARTKMADVFHLLGYRPQVAIEYEIRVGKGILSELMSMVENPGKIDTQSRPYTPHPIRWHRLQDDLRDERLAKEFGEALSYFIGIRQRRDALSIDLDLERGDFRRGSPQLFRYLQTLDRYRIVGLADLRLFRIGRGEIDDQLTLTGDDELPLTLSVTEASSGEQAVLLTLFGIAAEIEDSSLVVIDEPEISLHPEWQERIVPLLVSTFSGYHGCHFLIATHSPQVLSRAGEANAAIVVYENDHIEVLDAIGLSKRSADYQLATAFQAPGYRNEFLAREALAALQLASRGQFSSPEFKATERLLRNARTHLHADDPVAQMIDAVVQAAQAVGS